MSVALLRRKIPFITSTRIRTALTVAVSACVMSTGMSIAAPGAEAASLRWNNNVNYTMSLSWDETYSANNSWQGAAAACKSGLGWNRYAAPALAMCTGSAKACAEQAYQWHHRRAAFARNLMGGGTRCMTW